MDALIASPPPRPPITERPSYLGPQIEQGLTDEQKWRIYELQRDFLAKRIEARSTHPAETEPGRLWSQRRIDGAGFLSRKLAELETGLAVEQEIGRILRVQWRTGRFSLAVSERQRQQQSTPTPTPTQTQQCYGRTVAENRRRIHALLSGICTLRCHRQEILGRIQDDAGLLRRTERREDDLAYINRLVQSSKATYVVRRNLESMPAGTQTLEHFRTALVQHYRAAEAAAPDSLSSFSAFKAFNGTNSSGVILEPRLWCPVSAAFFESRHVRAAQIVHRNVGENAAQALFGEVGVGAEAEAEAEDAEDAEKTTDADKVDKDVPGHLWQPANGLLMHHRYAAWWDAGAIAIVPVDASEHDGVQDDGQASGHDPFDLKVVVLDWSIADDLLGLPPHGGAAALDGRRLQFRGRFRPAKPYLYFKLAVALLRRPWAPSGFPPPPPSPSSSPSRSRSPSSLPSPPDSPSFCFRRPLSSTLDEPAWATEGRKRLSDLTRELWRSPGSYLAPAVLFKFSRQIGFLTDSEAAAFWGMPEGMDVGRDDTTSDTLSMCLRLALDSWGDGKLSESEQVEQVDQEDDEDKEDEEEEKRERPGKGDKASSW